MIHVFWNAVPYSVWKIYASTDLKRARKAQVLSAPFTAACLGFGLDRPPVAPCRHVIAGNFLCPISLTGGGNLLVKATILRICG